MQSHYEEYWRRDLPPPTNDPLFHTRAEHLFSMIDAMTPRPSSMVDFGFGEGKLVALAHERGLDAVGLDIASTAIERAKARFPECGFHVHKVGTPLPIPVGEAEAATSFEVIEHLMHPAHLLQDMHRAIRPGGYIALTTPCHGVFKNIAISLLNFDTHFAVEGDHIRFFTDRSLRRLIEENGFAVEDVKPFGRLPMLWSGVFVWARKL